MAATPTAVKPTGGRDDRGTGDDRGAGEDGEAGEDAGLIDSSSHPFQEDCRSVPVSKKLSRYSSVPSSLSRTSEKTSAPLVG